MKIEFQHEPLAQISAQALGVFSFEGSPASSGTVAFLPAETRGLLAELQSTKELSGKAFECTLVHRPAGLATSKLLVVGAGKQEKFNDAQVRRLSGAAVRALRAKGVREMAWVLGEPAGDPAFIQAVVEGALLADYDADRYRTEQNNDRRIDTFWLATNGAPLGEPAHAARERGRILGEAQNFVRDLVNEPSNLMTPTLLAQRAQDIAAHFGL